MTRSARSSQHLDLLTFTAQIASSLCYADKPIELTRRRRKPGTVTAMATKTKEDRLLNNITET
ncbi:hypothetical protein T10_5448 [Trichinella papuae]|uniref:Uncharacterized protein n=1 Tax=Trichinella papuae TaxID=268474 RepID=A0A0V1MU29_9BILA|nr:hypothetical protein T10_5448 [Trichinella papuae]